MKNICKKLSIALLMLSFSTTIVNAAIAITYNGTGI